MPPFISYNVRAFGFWQPGSLQDNYATNFFSLLSRSDFLEIEEQLISRLIGHLRHQIQNTLLQFDPMTIYEAHQRALLIEQHSHGSLPSWNSSRSKKRALSHESTVLHPHETQLDFVVLSLNSDNNDGTIVLRYSRPSSFNLFGCGEQGPRQSVCPKGGRHGLHGEEEAINDEYADDHD